VERTESIILTRHAGTDRSMVALLLSNLVTIVLAALIIFLLLKTAADAAMHFVEHAMARAATRQTI
jgi:hypothetical protein